MGTWGTGLYANDLAEEVRDACNEIFSFYEVEEGNRKLFAIYRDLLNQDWIDNDYASFWYALADWQWKHGILLEQVKNEVLALLEVYAGIDNWIEEGNKRDIVKRKKVLDLLRAQIQQPQPPAKKPSIHLAKPKHKPGEIIIFKATDYVDEWDSAWHIKNLSTPFMFKSDSIFHSKSENINGYDAHGKYMAILCLGKQKKAFSEHIPDVYDEYSEYAWYDYLSSQKPSIEQLSSCGFLPATKYVLKDPFKLITESASWIYRFILSGESFKSNRYISFEKKVVSNTEVARFNQIAIGKTYSKDYQDGEVLTSMFYTAFEEKNRMELLNLQVDNLLDPNMNNPELLQPSEIDRMWKKHELL